jgi:uncharacterized protein YggE
MRQRVFVSSVPLLFAISVVVTACADGGANEDETALSPDDVVVERGAAAAGIGPEADTPAVQEVTTAGATGTGYGKATAPADAAVVAFDISAWPKGFGPVAVICANCTPQPVESPVDLGALLTEDSLDAVMDAIVAAGGERDSIEIDVQLQSLPNTLPQSQPAFNEPKVNGTVSVTVQEIDTVDAVAQAGFDAIASITEFDAQLTGTTVTYTVVDCAALQDAAGKAAAEDAAENARAAAAQVGLEVGAVIGVSNFVVGSPGSLPGDCTGSGEPVAFSPGAGLTAPAGDVEVAAQISVTYALD